MRPVGEWVMATPITCRALFDVRCRACQCRETVWMEIPVTEGLYRDKVMLDQLLNHRFSATHGKLTADQHGCDQCHAQNFEVDSIRRLPAYRETDAGRFPVEP